MTRSSASFSATASGKSDDDSIHAKKRRAGAQRRSPASRRRREGDSADSSVEIGSEMMFASGDLPAYAFLLPFLSKVAPYLLPGGPVQQPLPPSKSLETWA
jgi:hypothetical protein